MTGGQAFPQPVAISADRKNAQFAGGAIAGYSPHMGRRRVLWMRIPMGNAYEGLIEGTTTTGMCGNGSGGAVADAACGPEQETDPALCADIAAAPLDLDGLDSGDICK
jgi:hypothetical protein